MPPSTEAPPADAPAAAEAARGPLHARLREAPLDDPGAGGAALLADLVRTAEADASVPRLAELAAMPAVGALLGGVFSGSSYLSSLIQRDPARLVRLLECDPEARLAALLEEGRRLGGAAESVAEVMSGLRRIKTEIALLAGLADLGGVWPVMRVTAALTDCADVSVASAIRFLFRQAAIRGDWLAPDDPAPDATSGYFVLAMGKHGAHELNYSSDIDLIVFYDLDRLRLRDGLEAQAFFVRITRDLVKIMQERTGDGYVFRTDLRLRPDPGATQVALSTDAALHYYESFGQNWERAALIKARTIAGDLDAGRRLLKDLAPYIWRKYLDFAAIADIHAMKRQIHAYRGFGQIAVGGHNIKVGRGGIREIEFFAQTQQLIAGGRQTDLRIADTLSVLKRLVARGWIKPEVEVELAEAYTYLRRLEHRLQMVGDDQTHELPEDGERLDSLARFAGYATTGDLAADLVRRLETVQRHYATLFEDSPELTRSGVNMVFAGEQDDPATVAALSAMGYTQPSTVIAAVRGWHHGRYPAVRSPRARELLTEVQPVLIEALSKTADPDGAFARFDRFLAELPGGVQLFSLLRANPNLMRLVSDIMGSAPRLARIMGRRRRVLDAVLDPRVIGALPAPGDLARLVETELGEAADFQEVLDRARQVGSEQAFLIGVRLLSGMIGAAQAGGAYAALAECLIGGLHRSVAADFARAHGTVPGGTAVVVAMGKLGGREMTAGSDLDLIVVYDHDADAIQSSGERPLAVSQYYARFTQRLISALSAPTAEGSLYEVDMRLRPSGQKGPVATQFSSFVEYQAKEAWTWEHMALTRARVISGDAGLARRVEAAIRAALVRPRDRAKTAADVKDMRQRIAAEKGTDNVWDLKQARGGLVDLEFIVQHLQLVLAPGGMDVLDQSTMGALQKLERAGALSGEAAGVLVPATRLISDLTQILRLCLDEPFDPQKAPDGLKALLVRVGEAPSFAHLEARLQATQQEVAALFETLIA